MKRQNKMKAGRGRSGGGGIREGGDECNKNTELLRNEFNLKKTKVRIDRRVL